MKPKYSLSQNFLTDKNILLKIEKSLPPLEEKNIVEIGPGKGAITEIIISKSPKKLILMEKDDNLYRILMEKYGNKKYIKILNTDIKKETLKCDMIISSIPYSISRDIVRKIIMEGVEEVFLIVQKEFAEKIINDRIVAISVFTKTFMKVEKLFDIGKNSFSPQPKVDSSLIYFKRKNISIDKKAYWNWLNEFCTNKRKKIKSENSIINNRRIMKLSYREVRDIYVNKDIYSY